MANNPQEKRNLYHQRQRRGMQDVRFMMLLYVLGLLLYTALGYFLLSKLEQTPQNFIRTYLLYAGTSFLVWCIPIRMLWNFNRLGRWLFLLCGGISFYLAKDIVLFYELEVTPVFYQYMFLLLFGGKCIATFLCMFKLCFSYTIRCIWSLDDMFDDELEQLELPSRNLVEQKPKTMAKWEEKAQLLMKRASLRLGICLYVSFLFIFVLLTVLKGSLTGMEEAIGAIQYPLFSEGLFSVMVWSVPVFGLYMGKRWSPYLIYGSIFAEILRISLSFQDLIGIFTNRMIPSQIQILYVGIECMRYLLLLFACRYVLRSRLVKEYMHGGIEQNKE